MEQFVYQDVSKFYRVLYGIANALPQLDNKDNIDFPTLPRLVKDIVMRSEQLEKTVKTVKNKVAEILIGQNKTTQAIADLGYDEDGQ